MSKKINTWQVTKNNNPDSLLYDLLRLLLYSLPVLFVISCVNFMVDPVNLYKHRSFEDEVLDTLRQGKNVAGTLSLSQLDERILLKRYVPVLGFTPDILVLGNSRSYVIHKKLFPEHKFFNASIGSSAFGTMFAAYYLFVENKKVPRHIIFCIETDYFSLDPLPNRDQLWREFIRMMELIKVDFTYEERLNLLIMQLKRKADIYFELFSPAYFQDSINFIKIKNQWENEQLIVKEAKFYNENLLSDNIPKIGFVPTIDEEAYGGVLFTDFSKEFQAYYRNQTRKQKSAQVIDGLQDTQRLQQYPIIRSDSQLYFEKFIQYLIANNIKVYFYLMPLHPFAYEYENRLFQGRSAPVITEEYIRDYASRFNIPVIGSMDPSKLGLTEDDFFDHRHIFRQSISKLDWSNLIQ